MMQHLLVALFIAIVGCVVPDADLPSGTSVQETLAVGSWVIPMDNTLQSNGKGFNLRAYGLVNALLYANIPVKWVIKAGKTVGQPDFVANVRQLLPSPLPNSASTSFSAGPFVVPAFFVNENTTNPNSPGVSALSVIQQYNTRGTPVRVFQLTQSTTVPVRLTISKRPFIAVLNSSSNFKIQSDLLAAAGFEAGTHYRVMNKEDLLVQAEGFCISMATEPHFHAADKATNGSFPGLFVSAIRKFVKSGGNFLAQCAGLATYEQCDDIVSLSSTNNDRDVMHNQSVCFDGYFMTKGGFNLGKSYNDPGGAGINLAPDTPYAQYEGDWVTEGGSVSRLSLWNTRYDPFGTSTWRDEDQAHPVIQSYSATYRTAPGYGVYYAAHSKLRQYHGKIGGNVYYLTGHSYGTDGTAPGQRLYLNSVFSMANRDSRCGFDIQPCSWGSFNREFSGSVFLREPRTNSGIFSADFYYSWNNSFASFQFGPTSTESNFYNNNRGASDSSDQVSFRQSPSCCTYEKLEDKMPVLFPCPDEWRESGTAMTESLPNLPSKNCSVFRPTKADNPLSVLMIDTSSPTLSICYFRTKTGREVWFRSFQVSTSRAISQRINRLPLSTCTCGKVLDVAIVIDRRTSVSATEFALQKSFIRSIVDKTSIAPTKVTYTFVNYNTFPSTALFLSEGITQENVYSGLNSLNCWANASSCCSNPFSWTCDSCACGGASVSSGILMAASNLASSVRAAYSTKVMIVITSNYHDTLSTGTGAARRCYPTCNVPIGSDAWIACADPLMGACRSDLQSAVNQANRVPNMNIFAVGVDNYVMEELEIISSGKSENTFTAVSWEQLNRISGDIAAQMCSTGESPCQKSCCGICLCESCQKPVTCRDSNICTNETLNAEQCCTLPRTDCDVLTGNTNKCRTSTCSPNTGCQYTNLTCQSDNDCYSYTCNPTKGLPCEPTPKWQNVPCFDTYCNGSLAVVTTPKCVDPNFCYTSTCNPETDTCVLNPIAPPSNDTCMTYKCNASATSQNNLWETTEIAGCRGCPIACEPCFFCTNETGSYTCVASACKPVPCYTVSFNSSLPQCCNYVWACDDGDECTLDSCGTDGLCKHVPKTCDDGNICTQDSCDSRTGLCSFVQAPVCDDSSKCTADTCSDSNQNCTFLDIPCLTENKCLTPICVAATGCTLTAVTCDDFNPCTEDACDPAIGCTYELKVCDLQEVLRGKEKKDVECAVAFCNETSGECTYREVDCGTSDLVTIAAGITGGVLAGIILGIVVFCAAAGGGATAYYKSQQGDSGAPVNSNPLYEASKKGGNNPLYNP